MYKGVSQRNFAKMDDARAEMGGSGFGGFFARCYIQYGRVVFVEMIVY